MEADFLLFLACIYAGDPKVHGFGDLNAHMVDSSAWANYDCPSVYAEAWFLELLTCQ